MAGRTRRSGRALAAMAPLRMQVFVSTILLLATHACAESAETQPLADAKFEEEWGAWWTLFVVAVCSLFGFILLVTLLMLHHEQTYKTIAFKTIVLYLNLTATLGRLLYMVDPETFAGVYKPSTVFFLQRMPQVLWLTETLLFIVLWKRVYDAYAKAERISSRVTIGRYKYSVTALSVILLGGGTVTCSLQAANIEPDLMQNIVIILFATYVFGFLVGGIFYSIRLYYVMRKRTVKTDTFVAARKKLSRTVTIWLGVGVVWAIAFAWRYLTGTLSAFQYLLYYSILRACEGVMAFGGLAAIVPSKWTFFLPNWLLETVCRCKILNKTEGAIALTARSRPERSLSLSSEIKGGRAAQGSPVRGPSSRSGSANAMRYVRGSSGSGDADASTAASRGGADGTRNTLNPLHPDAQRALASEGSPSSGGSGRRPNGSADPSGVAVNV